MINYKFKCYNWEKFEHCQIDYWFNNFENKEVHAKMDEILKINKRLHYFLTLKLKKIKDMNCLLIPGVVIICLQKRNCLLIWMIR